MTTLTINRMFDVMFPRSGENHQSMMRHWLDAGEEVCMAGDIEREVKRMYDVEIIGYCYQEHKKDCFVVCWSEEDRESMVLRVSILENRVVVQREVWYVTKTDKLIGVVNGIVCEYEEYGEESCYDLVLNEYGDLAITVSDGEDSDSEEEGEMD